MIYDCFTFLNEFDLLEIRLHELNEAVDRVVIVEATHTWRGGDNIPGRWKEQERFAPFVQKIEHVVVEEQLPTDPWVAQAYVRNQACPVFAAADPQDLVIFGDADEIVRAGIRQTPTLGENLLYLDLRDYYYTLDWLVPIQILWERPIMVRAGDCRDLEALRHTGDGLQRVSIPEAGWHFSCLGQAETLAKKLRSFAHAELDSAEVTDLGRLAECIRTGTDLVIPPRFVCEPATVDDSYPRWVREHLDQYAHLLRENTPI